MMCAGSGGGPPLLCESIQMAPEVLRRSASSAGQWNRAPCQAMPPLRWSHARPQLLQSMAARQKKVSDPMSRAVSCVSFRREMRKVASSPAPGRNWHRYSVIRSSFPSLPQHHLALLTGRHRIQRRASLLLFSPSHSSQDLSHPAFDSSPNPSQKSPRSQASLSPPPTANVDLHDSEADSH
ncbi:hypothetical protein L1887_60007 [Cichorium endivia]|nr:hypothetical protein L1887_60007 [Cichorium endivia]